MPASCDAIMCHMRKATVRDLRYRFPDVETLLQEGEEIQITKHKRVIARLVPELASSVPRLPAFATRLAKIFGKKKLAVSGAQLIRGERDERN
jgi:antitoxin (DNA-binding transcriptional repressor) of toxin-antitoxin stability system